MKNRLLIIILIIILAILLLPKPYDYIDGFIGSSRNKWECFGYTPAHEFPINCADCAATLYCIGLPYYNP